MASHLVQARREIELGYQKILHMRDTLAMLDRALATYEEAYVYHLGHKPEGMEDVQRILNEVCHAYDVTPSAVMGKSRPEELVEARRMVVALAHVLTVHGPYRLGRFLKRDRKIILEWIHAHGQRCDVDRAYAAQFARLLGICSPPAQHKQSA